MRQLWASFILVLVMLPLHAKPLPKERPPEPKPPEPMFQNVDLHAVLTANDMRHPRRNYPAKTFTYRLSAGKTYVIDMIGPLDSYLHLFDKNGTLLAEDDDSGGYPNARITFVPKADDEYQIVTTSFNGSVGQFNLKIREEKSK